jgi:hypothetical protein
MGGCCSHDVSVRGRVESEVDDGDCDYDDYEDINDVMYENDGAIVRLRGFSKVVSMYTQQGKKGVNQDSMTVWEVINILNFHVLIISINFFYFNCLGFLFYFNFINYQLL